MHENVTLWARLESDTIDHRFGFVDFVENDSGWCVVEYFIEVDRNIKSLSVDALATLVANTKEELDKVCLLVNATEEELFAGPYDTYRNQYGYQFLDTESPQLDEQQEILLELVEELENKISFSKRYSMPFLCGFPNDSSYRSLLKSLR